MLKKYIILNYNYTRASHEYNCRALKRRHDYVELVPYTPHLKPYVHMLFVIFILLLSIFNLQQIGTSKTSKGF